MLVAAGDTDALDIERLIVEGDVVDVDAEDVELLTGPHSCTKHL